MKTMFLIIPYHICLIKLNEIIKISSKTFTLSMRSGLKFCLNSMLSKTICIYSIYFQLHNVTMHWFDIPTLITTKIVCSALFSTIWHRNKLKHMTKAKNAPNFRKNILRFTSTFWNNFTSCLMEMLRVESNIWQTVMRCGFFFRTQQANVRL